MINPSGIIPQKSIEILYKKYNFDCLEIPKVLSADLKPCFKCDPISAIEKIYKIAVRV
tara:strand:- start:171 stop:344 length:174 start_codon:yes stop_codon:yes gene_type:complete